MGKLISFECSDCNYSSTFLSGSGMLDFDLEKQKILFNCPRCGFLSLRTVKYQYNEEEGAYTPVIGKRQTCRKCKALMVQADNSEELTCPKCHSSNCKCFMSGVWD